MNREIFSEIRGSSTNPDFGIKVEFNKWTEDERYDILTSQNGTQWSGSYVKTLEELALVCQALGQVLIDAGITPGEIMGGWVRGDGPGKVWVRDPHIPVAVIHEDGRREELPQAVIGEDVEIIPDQVGPPDALPWVVSGGDRCPMGCGTVLHLYVDPFEDQHVLGEWCPNCGHYNSDLPEDQQWIQGLTFRGEKNA